MRYKKFLIKNKRVVFTDVYSSLYIKRGNELINRYYYTYNINNGNENDDYLIFKEENKNFDLASKYYIFISENSHFFNLDALNFKVFDTNIDYRTEENMKTIIPYLLDKGYVKRDTNGYYITDLKIITGPQI